MAAKTSCAPWSLSHSFQKLEEYPVFLNPGTSIPLKENVLQCVSTSDHSKNWTESNILCGNNQTPLSKEANLSPDNSANECPFFLISSLTSSDLSTNSWKKSEKTFFSVCNSFQPFITHDFLSNENPEQLSSSLHTSFGGASHRDCTLPIGIHPRKDFGRHILMDNRYKFSFPNSLRQNRQNCHSFVSGIHTLEKQTEDSLNPDSNPKSELHKKVKATEPVVLYRGKWMRTFRLLVRLKVIQLIGVATLALPIAEYTQEGHLSIGTIVAVGGVVGGAVIASGALWYYSQRYIGELALLPPNLCKVRISVLDFWGNRQDIIIARSSVVPPLKDMSKGELALAAKQTLLPFDVIGLRQFVLSIRHGRLLERSLLIGLLDGTLDSEPVPTDTTK